MSETTVTLAIGAERELIRQADERCQATGHLTYRNYFGHRDVVSCRRCGRTWCLGKGGKYRNTNVANMDYLLRRRLITQWEAFLAQSELPP